MWTSWVKGGIGLVALVFLMQVLLWILSPILDVAMAGPHSDDAVVQQVGGYFGAMTLDNLTILAALAVAIYLLGRAAVEKRLTG